MQCTFLTSVKWSNSQQMGYLLHFFVYSVPRVGWTVCWSQRTVMAVISFLRRWEIALQKILLVESWFSAIFGDNKFSLCNRVECSMNIICITETIARNYCLLYYRPFVILLRNLDRLKLFPLNSPFCSYKCYFEQIEYPYRVILLVG